MPTRQLSQVIQQLRQSTLRHSVVTLNDFQLLDSFLNNRDEDAFHALVQRHGPMVLGVCRRLLKNAHDSEDAFQATFLVLVRKASSITKRETVGGFLYGVAYKTALKARAADAKRRTKERQAGAMRSQDTVEDKSCHDWQPLLDQELSRLPEKYRVAVVLCDLEGKTRKEAAQQVGCPEGTLSSRLTRARNLLARRLSRHGLALAGGALAMGLSQQMSSACVPTALIGSTVKAATLLATGEALGAGLIAAPVAALTKGVLNAMLLTKIKIATAVLLGTSVLAMATGMLSSPAGLARAAEGEYDKKVRRTDSPTAEKSVRVQVRIASPAGMKVWVENATGQFDKQFQVEAPGRMNLETGARVRLKLAEIPNRPGLELYPIVQIAPTDAATAAFLSVSAIPIEFIDADFEHVAVGEMITRVVYLALPRKGQAPAHQPGKVVAIASYDYDSPEGNVIGEARKRGTILATVQMGNIDIEKKGVGRAEEGARGKGKPRPDVSDDEFIRRWLELQKVKQPKEQTDAELIRRIYLDVTGTLPTAEEVTQFVKDKDPDKRKKLMERVLLEPEAEAKIEAILKKLPDEEMKLHALDVIEKKVKEIRDKLKNQPAKP